MTALRLILRILSAPLVLALTVISFFLALLLAVSTRLLAVVSSLTGLLALLLFLSGNSTNGLIFLILAFAISPLGLPLIAERLWKGFDFLRGVLWRFVFAQQ